MQSFDLVGIVIRVIEWLPPLIFAITLHEVAHGWVAKQLGDPTALFAGRLTLNPVKHVDPLGTIIVPLALFYFSNGLMAFGWAKPVPVAFNNLGNPRRDMIFVAAAGPASNFLMALGWSLVMALVLVLPGMDNEFGRVMFEMGRFGILINVLLAVFNLVPIPPLDGGRVLAGLLPPRYSSVLDRIEPFGIIVVLALLWFGGLLEFLYPLISFFQGFYAAIVQSIANL